MKAFTLAALDTPPSLRHDLPDPAAREHEVLVRVHASSVNPVDGAIAAGMLAQMLDHEFPVVLGRDYAGVVEQVGPSVTAFAPGDEVFGFVPHAAPAVGAGAWAELIVVPDDESIARAPTGVDVGAAGAAPLAAITALTALDALGTGAGDTVLIVGATGGVGSLAVQLAAAAGATVIAPGLPEDAAFLHELGAGTVLERDADLAAAVLAAHPGGIDALLDVVSYTPDALDAFAAALKPGGRAASPNSAAGDGPGRANVMASPSTENLQRVAQLLQDGTLRVPIQRTYGFDQAGEALQALGTTHTQGKLALTIP